MRFFDSLRQGASDAAFEAQKLVRVQKQQLALSALNKERDTAVLALGNRAAEKARAGELEDGDLMQLARAVLDIETRVQDAEAELEGIRAEESPQGDQPRTGASPTGPDAQAYGPPPDLSATPPPSFTQPPDLSAGSRPPFVPPPAMVTETPPGGEAPPENTFSETALLGGMPPDARQPSSSSGIEPPSFGPPGMSPPGPTPVEAQSAESDSPEASLGMPPSGAPGVAPPPFIPPPPMYSAPSPEQDAAELSTSPAFESASRPRFCTNCGDPITETEKFCTSCGTRTGL